MMSPAATALLHLHLIHHHLLNELEEELSDALRLAHSSEQSSVAIKDSLLYNAAPPLSLLSSLLPELKKTNG